MVPGTQPTIHPWVWGRELTVQVGDPASEPFGISDYLPPVAHANLLLNEEVHNTVAELVGLMAGTEES
jgi:hypothetical protein